ncbi:hypothetical protein AKG98_4066 [Moritella sp. JT01]|uniref:hypothetical protein n=1 Tax=Moritella sp. JT01 TaxID=756698 RepID=UPI00079656E7|nr:hypothetical protein [Moritella sp. JT01]KXO12870.1 hypothetical protein AKG98_4066 [Moritella sp. JT01]
MHPTLEKNTALTVDQIFTSADLINIKKYVRYSVLAPDNLKKTIYFLGYSSTEIDILSPESFYDLFMDVNNNGRDWNSSIEGSFKDCISEMNKIYNKHYGLLKSALKELEELLENSNKLVGTTAVTSYLSNIEPDLTNIHNIIFNAWYDISYATAENDSAASRLTMFKDIIDKTRLVIRKKMDYIQYLQEESVRSTLNQLNDDFNFMLNFSLNAEKSATNLWAQWLTISENMDSARRASSSINTHSDLVDLYICLLDVVHKLESANEINSYMKGCFDQAEIEYSYNYPCGFVPLGDYLASSQAVQVDLIGECKNQQGRWTPFNLDLTMQDPVKTELLYKNGELELENNYPIIRGYCYFPGGNYAEHSRNVRVILNAKCMTTQGSYRDSSLELTYDLYLNVKNVNGVLTRY